MSVEQLPIPPHFDTRRSGEIWRVPYQERADDAQEWAEEHDLRPASADRVRVGLLAVDCQNTFCHPDFELFVAGRSGRGAIDDMERLCQFVYRNLGVITRVVTTMDTHRAMQIFHPIFWTNEHGEHPAPHTVISLEDVEKGVWKVNLDIAENLGVEHEYLRRHAHHYVEELAEREKFPLTVWPYHAMLGGIGHALVSELEEAIFFHCAARRSRTDINIKGDLALTENYSVLYPEVRTGPEGHQLAQKNTGLIERLLDFDVLIVGGEAQSHCVAWTVSDLLDEIRAHDPNLARKVYLLDDCTSPVVVPDVVDFTERAEAAFERFADAGMHRVRSTDPIDSWPEIDL